MEKYANRFSLPNEVMILKLSSKALAIYTYLLYCCDRKTYKCYPSYATIGENLQMSRGTVMKYVRELEDRLLISTEPTTITTKTGEVGNGNLMYTIEPTYKAMDNFYQEQLRKTTEKHNITKAQKKLEEYDRKHPRASA